MRTVLVAFLLTFVLCNFAVAQFSDQSLTPPPPTCPVTSPPYPATASIKSSNNFPASGDSVTFTATVTSACAGTPTGTVDFYITLASYTLLGTAELVDGKATITKSLTPWQQGATEYVVATYRGDSNFQGGDSNPSAPEWFSATQCGGGEISFLTFLGLAFLWHTYRRLQVNA